MIKVRKLMRYQQNIGLQQSMISQPRNKFIDRFRTHIVKSTVQYSQQKSERYLYSNRSGQLKSNYGEKSIAKVDIHQIIVDKLQRHIAYLQKKLKDAQQQNDKLNNYLSSCQNKIMQKEVQNQNLINQIQNIQEIIKKITWENEIVKSNYQNAVLQQKMQRLSSQVMQKKQAYAKIELKHSHHKRGKFSSAFLPSSFASSHKYTGRKPQQYQSIIEQYEQTNVKQSAVLPKNTLNNSLLNEWKQKKEENERLVKEAKQLRARSVAQLEQLSKLKKKAGQQQTIIQKLTQSNCDLGSKNHKLTQEYNLIMDKLRQNQEKMIDISIAIQQKSQLSLNDILQLFTIETHKPNLSIVAEVINITFPSTGKLQKQMQTDSINPQLQINKMFKLQSTIQTLTKRLQQKQIEIEQYRQSYTAQVTGLANLMKQQIDHIDQIDYSHEDTNAQCYQDKQEELTNKKLRQESKPEEQYENVKQEMVQSMDNSIQ